MPSADGDPNSVLAQRLTPKWKGTDPMYRLNLLIRVRNVSSAPVAIDRTSVDVAPASGFENAPFCKCDFAQLAPDAASRRVMSSVLMRPRPTSVAIELQLKDGRIVQRTFGVKVAPHGTRSGYYRFPAKTADGGPGFYWSNWDSEEDSHHHHDTVTQQYAYDLGARRHLGDGKWTEFVDSSEDGYENADYLIWNQPVYAMADGVVLQCKRNVGDNTLLRGKYPGGEGGGNHFWIQHDDGTVALYSHFRWHTVNTGLCPVETQLSTDGKTREVEALPVRVRAGQLLGRVGNTGSSSAPHLHVHLQRGLPDDPAAVALPLRFDRINLAAFGDGAGNSWYPGKPGGLRPAYYGIGEGGGIPSYSVVRPNPCGFEAAPDGPKAYVKIAVEWDCWWEVVDEAAGQGYSPAKLDGFSVLGGPFLNIVFVPTAGRDVVADYKMSADDFADAFTVLSGLGYRLLHVDAYRAYGEIYYTSVFATEGGAGLYSWIDMPTSLLVSRGQKVEAEGFRPAVINAAPDDGRAPRFNAIYEKRDIGSYAVRLGLDNAGLSAAFKDLTAKGLKPTYIGAYKDGAEYVFATIWSSTAGSNYVLYAGLKAAAAITEDDANRAAGRAPVIISGYEADGHARFAGLWRAPAASPRTTARRGTLRIGRRTIRARR